MCTCAKLIIMAEIGKECESNFHLKRQRENSVGENTSESDQTNHLNHSSTSIDKKKPKLEDFGKDKEGIPISVDGFSPDLAHAFPQNKEVKMQQEPEHGSLFDGAELPDLTSFIGTLETNDPGNLVNLDDSVSKEDGTTDNVLGAEGQKSSPDLPESDTTPERPGDDPPGLTMDDLLNTTTSGEGQASDHEDNISDISGVSDVSAGELRWTSQSGPIAWVRRQMANEVDPRVLLRELIPKDTVIPADMEEITIWKLVVGMLTDPKKRDKLPDFNTLEDAVKLIKECKNIMVLTGAGVSVSCGIPDFRSKDGIYSRLAVEYPDLPDPQAMFDIHYFRRNQKPFFKFAKEIYPGQFQPSPSHKFIKLIEDHKSLLRNYTQNIDTLEQVAGIDNVIQCHGSFVAATCMVCKHKVGHKSIEEDIMNQVIPRCPKCPSDNDMAIMKPDIVFFGESLPEKFHKQMEVDKDNCDLLIVMGSSLKVRPVALIPDSLPANVPQILINREPLKHHNFDIELLGDCDVVTNELCHRLGDTWESVCSTNTQSNQITRNEMVTPKLVLSEDECEGKKEVIPAQKDTDSMHLKDNGEAVISTDTKENISEVVSESNTADKSDSNTVQSTQDDDNREIKSNSVSTSESGTDSTSANTKSESTSASTSKSSKVEDSGETVRQGCKSDPEDIIIGKSTSGIDSEKKEVQSTDVSSSADDRSTAVKEDTNTPPSDEDQATRSDIKSAGDEKKESEPAESTVSESELQQMADKEKQLEEMRKAWQPRFVNLAKQLQENTFLFLPPNRHIFKGAEFLQDLDEVSEYSSSSSSSSSDDVGELSEIGDEIAKINKEHRETELLMGGEDVVTSGIESITDSDDMNIATTSAGINTHRDDVITNSDDVIPTNATQNRDTMSANRDDGTETADRNSKGDRLNVDIVKNSSDLHVKTEIGDQVGSSDKESVPNACKSESEAIT